MTLDQDTLNNILLFFVTVVGAVSAATWLGLILWTWRDMRLRSRDPLAQITAALMVAVLNVFGIIIYVMLRPPETLAEAYERSLEEEALLQNIEEKPICPGCGRAVNNAWQVCPYCHTKLKQPCLHCGEMLELAWNLCPWCATPQTAHSPAHAARHPAVQATGTPAPLAAGAHAPARSRQDVPATYPDSDDGVEFVDEEAY